MIDSKPSECRGFLDHDLVVDVEDNIYVVVGNRHPPGLITAYVKYAPTSNPTLWRGRFTYYERVLREYDVSELVKVMRRFGIQVYDPTLNVLVPAVPESAVRKWLKPELKMEELRRRASDAVELTAVEVSELMSASGVNPRNVGVTGSVLAGIHGRHSDVDLVIYGCRDVLEFVEAPHPYLSRMPANWIEGKIMNNSRTLGLSPNIYRRIIPHYKFLSYKGVPVTFTFVGRDRIRYGELVLKPVKPTDAVIEVEGGDCRALFYPSHVLATGRVEGVKVKGLISYEAEYGYVLYRGGRLRVSGMLEMSMPEEEFYLLVGGREHRGYVVPA
ncbi:MAG: hypothetical protein QW116_00500 [Zestosphaera sp.]